MQDANDINIFNFFSKLKYVDNFVINDVEFTKDGVEITFSNKGNYEEQEVELKVNNLLEKNFKSVPKLTSKGMVGGKYKILIETTQSYNNNPTAAQQEKGSIWIFNKVLKNKDPKAKFSTIRDIKTDPDYDELKRVFGGEVPNDWLDSYLKQQKKMFEIYASPDWDEFKYSGSNSFMDYIKDKVKSLGIKKYADWTPADIWMVKNQKSVEEEINSQLSKNGIVPTQTVSELNDILRRLFKEKKVVGVSLKKISGKEAKFEQVNIRIPTDDRTLRRQKNSYNVPKSKIKILLDLSYSSLKKSFGTQDLTVKLGNNYRFQIKNLSGNDRSFDNLKFEGTSIGSSSARGGKAPTEMVVELMKSNGVLFKNDHNNYPKNLEQFQKNQQKYLKMFNTVKRFVVTNITNDTEFISNFSNMFSSDKKNIIIANSKLMQLEFIFKVLQITPSSKYEEFWTDMFWISIRKGKNFGPHGKLY
jgi:hypothetical protein